MKKICVYFFSICSTILMLMSCKPSKQEILIKPETTKIKGALGEFYDVVDKDYKFTLDEEGILKTTIISITIKRNDNELPFDQAKAEPYGSNSEGKNVKVGIGIELLDENDNSIHIVQATASGLGGVYSHEDIEALINLQKGETTTIRWSIKNDLLSKAKKFTIASASEVEPDYSTSSISKNNYDDDYSYDNTNDIDSLLDSYEEYMEKYISIMKSAQSGNVYDVLDNQAELMSKADELSKKLDNSKSTMTSAQVARYTKITAKMMKAAYEE